MLWTTVHHELNINSNFTYRIDEIDIDEIMLQEWK